jgi:ABC-type sugar transport system ATPase subunit
VERVISAPATGSLREPVVTLSGITKRYGAVTAVSGVDLTVRAGEIHALVGENGAGKSTLGRIVAGAVRPDEGELEIDASPVSFRSPREALDHGVTLISQEGALVPHLSVQDNVYLGMEPRRRGFVDRAETARMFAALDDEAGFGLRGDALVGELRLADQQKVEILRAIARNARVIVMDEPTAALEKQDVEHLFDTMRRLQARGASLVFVSHFLEEVLEICDVVTVLKDGKLVRSSPVEGETPESLVTSMLGTTFDATFPAKRPPAADAPVVLSVRGLTRPGVIEDVSLTVRAGEIVGLAGLIGSGRSEVAHCIFGADPHTAGDIELDGRALEIRRPKDAIRAGIMLLPESRRDQGLLLARNGLDNIPLAHLGDVAARGLVSKSRAREATAPLVAKVDAAPKVLDDPVSSLSGGNQQKVLFAKSLFRAPRVLLADEPTRGVDVGAKRSIYELITSLAADGMAVVLISSDLEEVLGLAHRVAVMHHGRVVAELDGPDATADAVMRAAFSLTHSPDPVQEPTP